jgi:hypothetical protein
MINAIRLVGTPPEAEAPPVPTFLLFSSDLTADSRLLRRYVAVSQQEQTGEKISIRWMLPDPRLTLGSVTISRAEATTFRNQNHALGGVRLMLVSEDSAERDARVIPLQPYYVDWAGTGEPPATGAELLRAHGCREHGDYSDAVAAVAGELRLAVGNDGRFARHAAFALHEAAMVAEAVGLADAWEYFETLALIIYPNCHDALIGMALCARAMPGQALPLLGRAYAIRTSAEDLRLYGRAFAGTGLRPDAVRERIQEIAAGVDLDGQALPGVQAIVATDPDDVLRHVQALA